MKRFYVTAILLFFCCAFTFAQEEQPTQAEQSTWKAQRPRHELQFGVGDSYEFITDGPFDIPRFWPNDVDWFGPGEYTALQAFTPSISTTYHYRLLKWLCLGGYVSYAGAFTEVGHIIFEGTNLYRDHFITIAPSARISILNKKYVNLYGGLALGVTYHVSSRKYSETSFRSISHGFYLSGQITAIGVSVGKKWFGYTELGYGSKGIISAGFGYRFGKTER